MVQVVVQVVVQVGLGRGTGRGSVQAGGRDAAEIQADRGGGSRQWQYLSV